MNQNAFSTVRQHVTAVCDDVVGTLAMLPEQGIDRVPPDGILSSLERLRDGKFEVAFVGQMKAGKSTLANAMIFGREVLPIAATPMTAKLAVIQGSDTPKARAFFFSREKWSELKRAGNLDSPVSGAEFSYARVVAQARAQLGSELESLLGTHRTIRLEDLADYVGSWDSTRKTGGRYTAVTERVEIDAPMRWPEHVVFVDTPGTNDPDEFREAVTLEYLAKADAVVLVLYSGSPASRAEIDFLRHHLVRSGYSKILIAFNQVDEISERSFDALQKYVTDQIRRTVLRELEGTQPEINSLLEGGRVHPVSGLRALLGRSNRAVAEADFYWDRLCASKGINTNEEAVQRSGVPEFEQALESFLLSTKGRATAAQPLRKAKAALSAAEQRVGAARELAAQRLQDFERTLSALQTTLDEQRDLLAHLEENQEKLKSTVEGWILQELKAAEREARRKVDEFERDVRSAVFRKVDAIGTLDCAFGNGHISEINRELGIRVAQLEKAIGLVYDDCVGRVRTRIEADFPKACREHLSSYAETVWFMKGVNELHRVEIPLEFSDFSHISDKSGFRAALRALFFTRAYREDIKAAIESAVEGYAESVEEHLAVISNSVLKVMLSAVGTILEGARRFTQRRQQDLVTAIQAKELESSQRAEARKQVEARVEQLNHLKRRIDSLGQRVDEATAEVERLGSSG